MSIDTVENKLFGTTRDADESTLMGRNVMLWMVSVASSGDIQSDLVSYKLGGSGLLGENFVVTGMRPNLEVNGSNKNIHCIVFNKGAMRIEYHVWSLTDGSGSVLHLVDIENSADVYRESVFIGAESSTQGTVKVYQSYTVGYIVELAASNAPTTAFSSGTV